MSIVRLDLRNSGDTAGPSRSAVDHLAETSLGLLKPSRSRGRSVAGVGGAFRERCRHGVRDTGMVVSFAKRPAMFTLARALHRQSRLCTN
jgi:hypothetical protein